MPSPNPSPRSSWAGCSTTAASGSPPTSPSTASTRRPTVEHLVGNLLAAIDGSPLPHRFDGHANCFVESGRGEALLLDFNYDTQPLTGTFPLPAVGPMKLLGRSRMNHLGKLAFEQIYWNLLLRGRPLPVPTVMSMQGKVPAEKTDRRSVRELIGSGRAAGK